MYTNGMVSLTINHTVTLNLTRIKQHNQNTWTLNRQERDNSKTKSLKSQYLETLIQTRLSTSRATTLTKEDVLAKSRSHLVSKRPGDNHTIRLTRTRPEDDTESIQIVASSTRMHHFHGAAREAEGHGPDRSPASPVHEVIDLRDHELRRLRETRRRRRWGRRRTWSGVGSRRRRWGESG